MSGGRVERKHGKKYVKIRLAVDVETKDGLAMLVTADGTHDSRPFLELLSKAETRRKVSKVIGHGAYIGSRVCELLEKRGIEAVIKPRRNSRLDTPSQPRREAVTLYKRLDHRRWAKLKGHGKDGMRNSYSTFKRVFGESCMAKTFQKTTKELAGKAYICNALVNLWTPTPPRERTGDGTSQEKE